MNKTILFLFAVCFVVMVSGCVNNALNQELTNQTVFNLSIIDDSDFNILDDSVPNFVTDQEPSEAPIVPAD